MTGEMHPSEVTEEAFPLHFAMAKAIGGTVHPFDQYQGPYVRTPTGERLFVCWEGDGDDYRVWNERTGQSSDVFWCDDNPAMIVCSVAAVYGDGET